MDLNPGDIVCRECGGTGNSNYNKPDDEFDFVFNIKCPKCNGIGKLDWVENVVGKKQHRSMDSTSLNIYNLVR
jgi:DnaJ-class molecular chaperone